MGSIKIIEKAHMGWEHCIELTKVIYNIHIDTV